MKSTDKISIYSLSLNELKAKLNLLQIKPYVADQLYNWLYIKNVKNFNEMKNISEKNLNIFNKLFFINTLFIQTIQEDKKDYTTKFLLKLEDNNCIETVLMKFDYGYSLCISTQIGCNMGCTFCASGLIKKIRDLTIDEMILQLIIANNFLEKKQEKRISHIVVMGIGEPFDNFNNLLSFLNIVRDQKGLNIGSRRITVSTCGLVNKINEWSLLEKQVNLAISFHGSNNDLRSKLMPINRGFNIEKLMQSINDYISLTNKRVTIEYILIKDLNDKKENAMELVNLFKNKLVYINLIPYNPVNENGYLRSENINYFFNILQANGITCTVRQEKGTNIDAACGQLRNKNL